MKSKKEIQQIRELNELQSTNGPLGLGGAGLMGLFLNGEDRNAKLLAFKDDFDTFNGANLASEYESPTCFNINNNSGGNGNVNGEISEKNAAKSKGNGSLLKNNDSFKYAQNGSRMLDEDFYSEAFENLKNCPTDQEYNTFYNTYNKELNKNEAYPIKSQHNGVNENVEMNINNGLSHEFTQNNVTRNVGNSMLSGESASVYEEKSCIGDSAC